MTPPTSNKNGRSAAKTPATSSTDADPSAVSDGLAPIQPTFLSELAVAMRATAQRERKRIGMLVDADATAHVEKVRARAAIETEELRRLAEQDVEHVEEWKAAEMERIRAEADRKINDRRTSLEEYLKQHDLIIEKEIEGVGLAVRDYNTTLDDFFAKLAGADDPADIAARAEALPPPPDLDEVRSRARSSAVTSFAEPAAAAPVVDAEAGAEARTDGAAIDPATTADVLIGDTPAPADQVQAVEIAPSAELEADGPGQTHGTTLMGDTEASRVDTAAAEASSGPAGEPVPVMDPASTSGGSWADTEPEAEPVAASVDHTSAAVRLLRSVAPWTAPTHSGSEEQESRRESAD